VSVKNARRICITLLVLLFAVSAVGFLTFSVDKVRAQSEDIEAGIYPSEGTGATEISIRFYTRNASIGNVDKADLFWDGVSKGLNRAGVVGADGSYNYLLNVPSERPPSDIGNHTIMADRARALAGHWRSSIIGQDYRELCWRELNCRTDHCFCRIPTSDRHKVWCSCQSVTDRRAISGCS